VTTPTSQQMLDKYLTAEQDLLAGKDVRWGDRRLIREDLPAIIKGRQEWQSRVAGETRRAKTGSSLNLMVSDFSGLPGIDRFTR